MKSKYLFVLLAVFLALAIILTGGIVIWQKVSQGAKEMSLLGKLTFKKRLEEQLTGHVWWGRNIDMPGLTASAAEVFGSEPVLTFQKNGSCSLRLGEEVRKGRWKIKDEKIILSGGIKTDGFLELDWQTRELESLYLLSIDNYAVRFITEDELAKIAEQIKKRQSKRERQLAELLNSPDFYLSTCRPEFVALLLDFDFVSFEPLDLAGADREGFMAEHFAPLLSLGLQHSSWIWVYDQDIERILAGYELYEFNLPMDPAERKARAGEQVLLPLAELARYIGPRIRVKEDRIVDVLEEMLRGNQRYCRKEDALAMLIKEEVQADFAVELVAAWQHEAKTVIHVLYKNNAAAADQAWFVMSKNPGADCQTYLAGSFYRAGEPEG